MFNYRPNLELIPAELNSIRGELPYKDFASKSLSTYAKNEPAMQYMIGLEARMEGDITGMIKDPRLIPMPKKDP